MRAKTLLDEWCEGRLSPLAEAIEQRAQNGQPVIDLVNANPHDHGIAFPSDVLADIMAHATFAARIYRPDPRGQMRAREAVAAYHGGVAPSQIVLTCGTSMAYWYAFRLLARPGGNVLCPSPTYPLFEDLARAAGLAVRSYHLAVTRDGVWRLDLDELEFQITPNTVALALVSPHNPTGMVANRHELVRLGEIAARHKLAVVFDEVFREFLHTDCDVPRPAECGTPLVITLNGLSKMLALPQLKAGWMVVQGTDAERVAQFLAALEYLADTFLPVNEMVQAALPELLAPSALAHTARFAAIYRQRMSQLIGAWSQEGVRVPMPEAGVYAVVPLPARWRDREEHFCTELARRCGIVLHPAQYYGYFPYAAVVMTCVAAPPWPLRAIVSAFTQYQ